MLEEVYYFNSIILTKSIVKFIKELDFVLDYLNTTIDRQTKMNIFFVQIRIHASWKIILLILHRKILQVLFINKLIQQFIFSSLYYVPFTVLYNVLVHCRPIFNS